MSSKQQKQTKITKLEWKSSSFLSFASVPNQSRREFLWRFGGGLGGIALAHLLGEQRLLGGLHSISGSAIPGALPKSHHPPKARRVIQLFMNGGASQMDL